VEDKRYAHIDHRYDEGPEPPGAKGIADVRTTHYTTVWSADATEKISSRAPDYNLSGPGVAAMVNLCFVRPRHSRRVHYGVWISAGLRRWRSWRQWLR
jgi:hypothetical protein